MADSRPQGEEQMRRIQSDQLGDIAVADEAVIHFLEGIPGFEECHDFVLIEDEEITPFRWLQSLDDGAIAFIVVDPVIIFPGYQVKLGPAETAAIRLTDAKRAQVQVILTISEDPEKTTANLQGPLLINAEKNLGCQVLLTRSLYETRYPVMQGLAAAGRTR
jgi:flagellar assembly factor FliW